MWSPCVHRRADLIRGLGARSVFFVTWFSCSSPIASCYAGIDRSTSESMLVSAFMTSVVYSLQRQTASPFSKRRLMKTYQRERRWMGFRYVAQPPAFKGLQSTTNRVLLIASERDRRSRGTSCFIFITFLIDLLIPGWIFTSYKAVLWDLIFV